MTTAPELLSEGHDLSDFYSGQPALDDWLKKQARSSEGRTARTIVVCDGSRVVGYYCLAAGMVARGHLPSAKLRKNAPAEIPVVILGRLAVDEKFQQHGIGKGLLKDAILRSLLAASTVGVRAMLVHPINDKAAAFYARFGFLSSAIGPETMMLPIETAAAALPT
ncbi:GNAT family N-acetyltransferase [Hypericibacter sp.]|uniref:GNAT family N-acetyltransferase n=1 Tax=Hypericibacter sp. TaxID=2705401 RepID=UPI003D6CF8C0